MSLHSSLRGAGNLQTQKSVLSKLERIKFFISQGRKLEEIPIFGTPKVKVVRVKVSKRSAPPKEQEEGGQKSKEG